MKAFYDSKPSTLEAAGNGSYLYRYRIEETAPETAEVNVGEEKAPQWQCHEVTVWEPVSSNGILQAVLAAEFPGNREQKYINEYNAAVLGVSPDGEAEEKAEAYKAFLKERAALKAQVDADCAELGIA